MSEPMKSTVILKNIGNTQHDLLHTVCRHLPTDFEPYGKRERNDADCSCGCRHFLTFAPPLGYDWGVCINPRSPRSGLLTFEHQGCEFFEEEEDGSKDKEFVAELRKRTPSKLAEKKSQT